MKDFNGGYIEASFEAYYLLTRMDLTKGYYGFGRYIPNWRWIIVVNDGSGILTSNATEEEMIAGDNNGRFYINNGELSWEKPEGEENAQTTMDTNSSNTGNGNSLSASAKTISITSEDGTVYEKACTKCTCVKNIKYFGKDKKSQDGLTYWCKRCTIAERRTKNGLVIKIYNNQKRNSVKRGHASPSYTQDELKEWLFCQPVFHELYDSWRISGFDKDLAPSVDRIDDSIGYRMSNIQVMSFGDNKKKHYIEKIEGKSKSNNKEVKQFTKDGNFVAAYHSGHEAERVTGINRSHISSCCNGNRKTAGGFKWKF